MSISRKRTQEYTENVLEVPRSQLPLILKRGKTGVTLLYRGKAVTRCHASRVGARQAVGMALALGVELPPAGSSVRLEVPFGVLFRAIAISSLDLRKPEALVLMRRYLEEAQMQRGMGGAVA